MNPSGHARNPLDPANAPAAAEALQPQALVAQLGSEVASHLSSALERVNTLAATGRIDKAGLRLLREELEQARRAGIVGQQLARLSNGQVQLANERLDLTGLLREALRLRGREIEARGIEVRQLFAAVEVMSDATLLFSLLETLLDWSFAHAISRIDLQIDIQNWPAHGRLASSFAHRPADEAEEPATPAAALDSMDWRLLQQTATVLGLALRRRDSATRTEVLIEFTETLPPRLFDSAAGEAEDVTTQAHNSQPLAGRHVVVLAARREVRNVVRDALRPMGLMIDFVTTLDEAQQLFAGGLPHAVVYEASLGGDRFERLRTELRAEVPGLAFIQIAEQGRAFEVLNLGGRQFASVGRDAIIESLPAALLFELSRHG